MRIVLLLVISVLLAAAGMVRGQSPIARSAGVGDAARSAKEVPQIEAQQTDLVPAINTVYRLAKGSIWKNEDQRNPGPEEIHASRAWRAANEFVSRTALRQLCQLPAHPRIASEKDGYTIYFKRNQAEGELRVWVSSDFQAASWEGIASRVFTNDGLGVTVMLPKPTLAADEPLAFLVQFRNASNKTLSLYDADYFWNWEIHFLGSHGQPAWKLRYLVTDQLRAMPKSQTLKPGETLLVTVNLPKSDNYDFVWEGVQKDMVEPVKRLPPGGYQLEINFDLKVNADAAKRSLEEWAGQITTKALDFEISDKPAAVPGASAAAPPAKDGQKP